MPSSHTAPNHCVELWARAPSPHCAHLTTSATDIYAHITFRPSAHQMDGKCILTLPSGRQVFVPLTKRSPEGDVQVALGCHCRPQLCVRIHMPSSHSAHLSPCEGTYAHTTARPTPPSHLGHLCPYLIPPRASLPFRTHVPTPHPAPRHPPMTGTCARDLRPLISLLGHICPYLILTPCIGQLQRCSV